MPAPLLNKTTFQVKLRRGLRSRVERSDVFSGEGELAFTTDTKNLWTGNASYGFDPVQTLDMLVSHEDQAVFHNDQAVFHI